MNPPITHVLLDMDGVLADFFTPALEKLNRKFPSRRLSTTEYVKQREFAMDKMFGITQSQFWTTIEDDNFWEDLKPMTHAQALLDFLTVRSVPYYIASSPSYHPTCVTSKVKWLKKHFGINMSQAMFGSAKYLMAKPNALLIDDLPKNVDKFILAGGQAVCVPSNWNTEPFDVHQLLNPIENILCKKELH